MIPHYESKSEPRQNIIDFESAKEILMKGDDKTVVKTRFERNINVIAFKSYFKNEDFPENKKIFIYGFNRYLWILL